MLKTTVKMKHSLKVMFVISVDLNSSTLLEYIIVSFFLSRGSGSQNLAANTRDPIPVEAFREYIQSLKDDEYGSLMDEFKVSFKVVTL